jgi:hypothetical protein
MIRTSSRSTPDPESEAFVRRLVAAAAERRLPEVFTGKHPHALHVQPDRHGVSVVVLRTSDLDEQQLLTLMKYRLAQYLAVEFVDARLVYERGMEAEPLSDVSPRDVHVIAGSTGSGEILCYACLKAAPDAPDGTSLRTLDRPLLAVEKIHGWAIYNRLPLLPDLPLVKVRELGRFVKNQRLAPHDERGSRAPVEVGLALFRAIAGPLRLEVEAIVGDLEDGVAKRNLEFFHAPITVIRGTIPYEEEASYFYPRYQHCATYPFAGLCCDITERTLDRLAAIEKALQLPGRAGLLALLALKNDRQVRPSSLESVSGLPPLLAHSVPQVETAMRDRRRMLEVGRYLRQTELLSSLSVAEAALLGTLMERRQAAAGEVIVRRGDTDGDLAIIETGQAESRLVDRSGRVIALQQLGPGQYFGKSTLLTGDASAVDVVALTPMTLLCLSKAVYTRYLAHLAEVHRHIASTAARRANETVSCLLESA